MTIIRLDGIPIRLENPDLDKDGKTGGVESVQRFNNQGVSDIIQPTELGEAMKDMNNDEIEPGTRMSKIDMRTRLHVMEINSLWAVDSLVALKFLPTSCLPITRQRKRLLVSLGGEGRKEAVRVIAGEREKQANSGFMGGMKDKIQGLLPGGNK